MAQLGISNKRGYTHVRSWNELKVMTFLYPIGLLTSVRGHVKAKRSFRNKC